MIATVVAILAIVEIPFIGQYWKDWQRERKYAENDRLESIAARNFAENKDYVLSIYDQFIHACQFARYHRSAGNDAVAKRWEDLRERWRPFLVDPKAMTVHESTTLLLERLSIQDAEGPIDSDRALGIYYRMVHDMPLPKYGSSHIERLAIFKDFK